MSENQNVDPYQPPESGPESPDEMPAVQRQMLLEYLDYRDNPPTYLSLLPRFMLRWVFIAAIALVIVALATLFGIAMQSQSLFFRFFFWGMVGFVVGAFYSTIIMLVRFVRIWPYLVEYLDYEKIERDLSA